MFGDNNKTSNDNPMSSNTQPVNDGLMGLNNQQANDGNPSGNGQTNNALDSTQGAASSVTNDQPTILSDPVEESVNEEASATQSSDNDLLNIKKEALMELSPLVKELDQNPDEKFETLMMMIQATDNKSLIASAFETAKKISDDKKRARALLDIINEINEYQNDQILKWFNIEIVKYQNGLMTRWSNIKMVEYLNDRVSKWSKSFSIF